MLWTHERSNIRSGAGGHCQQPVFRSHLGVVFPGHEVCDISLHVIFSDGSQGRCHPSVRIDGVQFAGLDHRGDGGPVLGSRVVSDKESVLSVERDGSDGAFNGVIVEFDPAVGPEQTVPVFGDVGKRLAER